MDKNIFSIKKENEEGFKEIAQKLFNEIAIQTHDSIYRLTEIEFYWTSQNHNDKSTYERRHVNPNQGEWFFHYSGVDIALKNDEIGGYGGILIRGIFDLNNQKPYKGPLVCLMRLFSGTSVFQQSIQTKLVEYKFDKEEIRSSIRIGLGKNAQESGTDKLNYRFTIKL
jgi:hypothetical protein